MKLSPHRWRGWFVAMFLVAAFFAAGFVSWITAPLPGTPERQFLSIKRGMSYQEALGLLETTGGVRTYFRGTTFAGQSFFLLMERPPAGEIKEGRLDVDDGNDCWSATLFLGEGGVVTDKQFDPYMTDPPILHFLHRAFGH